MATAGNDKLIESMVGVHLGFAACAAAELGLANLIPRDGAREVEALAAEAGCNPDHLYRLLRLLASHGIFEETARRTFALTPAAESMRDDADQSTRAGWRLFHRVFGTAQQGLLKGLRTETTPLAIGLGMPIFEFLGSHPEDAAIFDAGMMAIHGPETLATLRAYDFSGISTLADIGGGNGSVMTEALNRHKDMHGILFDREHVVERARASIETAGVSARCQLRSGDFFDSIPEGADAYMFRHIIHDWTDEQSVVILKNCRKVMPANGRLLIVEAVVPPGNERSIAKDFDFVMLLYPGGKERTEKEYQALFAAAGFALTGVTPTNSMVSVVEGRPA
jgi:hypothetical protein